MLQFLLGKTIRNGGTSKNRRYPEHLIELSEVSKVYKTEAGDFSALKNVKLAIGEGEFVGIIGKSGSGKSTLINMMSGIDRPTRGQIVIDNTPIHTLGEGKMARWRGKSLGIVFQFFQLLPMLTVAENVMLPMDFCNLYSPRKRRERALHLLNLVAVEEQANKLPSQLSGGQQQRVAIARALANDPPIIMADEPTGNLDSKTAERIFALFEALVKDGKTIVLVTHDSDLAKRVSRTIIISDGELVEEYLSRTFPELTQPQLVWITSKLKEEVFAPTATIVRQGEMTDKLYIVTQGTAEVWLQTAQGHEMAVSRIERGQYFGEVPLLRGSASTVTVRAAPGSNVHVATLDKESFNKLIADSEPTKREIESVAEGRIQSNGTLSGGVGRD